MSSLKHAIKINPLQNDCEHLCLSCNNYFNAKANIHTSQFLIPSDLFPRSVSCFPLILHLFGSPVLNNVAALDALTNCQESAKFNAKKFHDESHLLLFYKAVNIKSWLVITFISESETVSQRFAVKLYMIDKKGADHFLKKNMHVAKNLAQF
jgi:hypothetical protein